MKNTAESKSFLKTNLITSFIKHLTTNRRTSVDIYFTNITQNFSISRLKNAKYSKADWKSNKTVPNRTSLGKGKSRKKLIFPIFSL